MTLTVKKPSEFSDATKAAFKEKLNINQGTISEAVAGVGLGQNSTDFQYKRESISQTARGTDGFIAGGRNNKIESITERASVARNCHVEGNNNAAYDWDGHAEGNGCIVDGKISHGEGNNVIASGNDSHCEGAFSSTGRIYYENVTTGLEDAGDGLGQLQFVLIPDTYGDVSKYFPNTLTTDLVGKYGSGAQMDTKGNIYTNGYTPAIWDGDTVVTKNDLTWALHSICILKGSAEIEKTFVNIKKCTYMTETGTKVYYEGSKPFTSIIGIYTSTSPLIFGNIQHAEGIFTTSCGRATHAEGYHTRAIRDYSHAEGYYTESSGYSSHSEGHKTKAGGEGSHAEGRETIASGKKSHAEGYLSQATGDVSHAEGYNTQATYASSHAEGDSTIASGAYSHAEGKDTEAIGWFSHSSGKESIATRNGQKSHSAGKRLIKGDNQIVDLSYSREVIGIGWHEIQMLPDIEDGKSYHIEAMIIGVQTGGTAGALGDTFAFKFNGVVRRSGTTYTKFGTHTFTPVANEMGVAFDFADSYFTSAYNRASLKYTGIADTTFYVTVNSRIQELG